MVLFVLKWNDISETIDVPHVGISQLVAVRPPVLFLALNGFIRRGKRA